MARLIREIHRLMGYPDTHWNTLCLPALEGMEKEKLELIRRALVVRQGRYLPPGAGAEEIYAQRDVWTYAVFAAALERLGANRIPPEGRAWLERHHECMEALEQTRRGTGPIHDILTRAGIQSERRFLDWLKESIRQGEIPIGTRGAPLHIVQDGLLLLRPKLFRLFDEDWEQAEHKLLAEIPEEMRTLRIFAPKDAPLLKFKGYVLPKEWFDHLPLRTALEVADLEEIHA